MSHLADLLRFRRAIAKQAGQRIRRRKKIPRQREAAGARVLYQKQLTEMRRTLERLLREVLFPALPAIMAQAESDRAGVRLDSATDDIIRVFGDLQVQFATIHPPEEVEQVVTEVASNVNVKQAGEHQRQMKAALGIEAIIPEPFTQEVLKNFIADNQKLVQSLFGDRFNVFQTITSKGIRGGLRVESIRDELLQALDITKGKASLLARDQTLKLFGEFNQHRQQNVGINSYTWDTSKDERVRQFHQQLDGTSHKWTQPPVTDAKGRRNHPGQDFQCRCQPIPIIPESLLAADVAA